MPTFTNSLWSEVSFEEQFGNQNSSVTRTFKGPYSERVAFLTALRGGITEKGGLLYRLFPARHPDYWWMWCTDAKVTRIDSETAGAHSSDSVNPLLVSATHGYCFITATYAPPDNDSDEPPTDEAPSNEQQEIDLATHSWDFTAKQLTLPNKYYQWETNGGGIAAGNDLLNNQQINATITFPQVQILIVRHMLFRKPMQAILDNLGRVNKVPFQLAGDTYPAESLRFDSAKASRKITTNGVKFYELTYGFACQPIWDTLATTGAGGYVGWNRLFNPKTGKWHRVYLASDHSRYIYLRDDDGPTQPQCPNTTGFRLLFHPRAK